MASVEAAAVQEGVDMVVVVTWEAERIDMAMEDMGEEAVVVGTKITTTATGVGMMTIMAVVVADTVATMMVMAVVVVMGGTVDTAGTKEATAEAVEAMDVEKGVMAEEMVMGEAKAATAEVRVDMGEVTEATVEAVVTEEEEVFHYIHVSVFWYSFAFK